MKVMLVFALLNVLLLGRSEKKEDNGQASVVEEQQVTDKDHNRSIGLGLAILGSSFCVYAGIELLRGRNATRARYRS